MNADQHSSAMSMPSMSSFRTPASSVSNVTSMPNSASHEATNTSRAAEPATTDTALPILHSEQNVEAMLNKLNISVTIGLGDVMEGRITMQEGKCIVVRGTVKGEINCPGTVLIMDSAVVEGNIKAGQLWLEGEVRPNGNEGTPRIEASALHIGSNALVIADCFYEKISIATSSSNRGIKGRLESLAVSQYGK
jgi:cytoskeletal protein CcmA (bactofilin family)